MAVAALRELRASDAFLATREMIRAVRTAVADAATFVARFVDEARVGIAVRTDACLPIADLGEVGGIEVAETERLPEIGPVSIPTRASLTVSACPLG